MVIFPQVRALRAHSCGSRAPSRGAIGLPRCLQDLHTRAPYMAKRKHTELGAPAVDEDSLIWSNSLIKFTSPLLEHHRGPQLASCTCRNCVVQWTVAQIEANADLALEHGWCGAIASHRCPSVSVLMENVLNDALRKALAAWSEIILYFLGLYFARAVSLAEIPKVAHFHIHK